MIVKLYTATLNGVQWQIIRLSQSVQVFIGGNAADPHFEFSASFVLNAYRYIHFPKKINKHYICRIPRYTMMTC